MQPSFQTLVPAFIVPLLFKVFRGSTHEEIAETGALLYEAEHGARPSGACASDAQNARPYFKHALKANNGGAIASIGPLVTVIEGAAQGPSFVLQTDYCTTPEKVTQSVVAALNLLLDELPEELVFKERAWVEAWAEEGLKQ